MAFAARLLGDAFLVVGYAALGRRITGSRLAGISLVAWDAPAGLGPPLAQAGGVALYRLPGTSP